MKNYYKLSFLSALISVQIIKCSFDSQRASKSSHYNEL